MQGHHEKNKNHFLQVGRVNVRAVDPLEVVENFFGDNNEGNANKEAHSCANARLILLNCMYVCVVCIYVLYVCMNE